MRQREPRASAAAFVLGALFLFCGGILLLQSLGVLPWSVWGALWKFWPVLLIIGGLALLFPHRRAWVMALLVLTIVGACLGIAALQARPSLANDVIPVTSYRVPLAGITAADVTIEFSAGSLIIDATEQNDDSLIDAAPEVRGQRSTLHGAFNQVGDTGRLSLKAVNQEFLGNSGIRWMLRFTRQVPLDMDIKAAAARLSLDFRELRLKQLRLQMSVSDAGIRLPAPSGNTVVSVHADVSNLVLEVPDGVAARIKADVSLAELRIDAARFTRQGDYYVTTGFDSAADRLTLDIVCDVGRVVVE